MRNGDKGHGLFSAPKFKDQIFETIITMAYFRQKRKIAKA